MKKWLQLRNRDSDHRIQVEERRRKREEEAKVWIEQEREKNEIFHSRLFKAKIDDLLRREKEREQRVNHHRTQKADSAMTMSTDVLSTRRAVSASRLRSNHPGKILFSSMENRRFSSCLDSVQTRRGLNDSTDENSHRKFLPLYPHRFVQKPKLSLVLSAVFVTTVEKNQMSFSPLVVPHTYQDEQAIDQSNDESLFSGIPYSSSARPMSPRSHVYWLNTGAVDTSNQTNHVHFMRATFATKCRRHHTDRIEHCPRAGKGIQPVSRLI